MSNIGWISLYRSIQDCWIWTEDEKFDKAHAWIDLLLLANHRDKKIAVDKKPKVIVRGQFLTSKKKLAARWNWNIKTVRKFLDTLESDGMIAQESTCRWTTITIVNYGVYQQPMDNSMDKYKDKSMDTYTDRSMDTNNNDNKDNNINKDNKYNVHFEEFWSIYPRKEGKSEAYKQYKARLKDGWSEGELLEACRSYADVCEKDKREKQYIKQGKTFLSINTPFIDYLQKGDKGNANKTGSIGYESEYIDIPTDEEFAAFYGTD